VDGVVVAADYPATTEKSQAGKQHQAARCSRHIMRTQVAFRLKNGSLTPSLGTRRRHTQWMGIHGKQNLQHPRSLRHHRRNHHNKPDSTSSCLHFQ